MKKKKHLYRKFLASLLSVAMVLGMVQGTPVRAETIAASGEGWSLDENGKLTISSQAGMDNWGQAGTNKSDVTCAEISADVTEIKSATAFSTCSKLETITLLSRTPPTLPNTFLFNGCPFYTYGLKGIHVPAGCGPDYRKGNWATYSKNVTDVIEQADGSVTGNDWTLDSNGNLKVTTQNGMDDWAKYYQYVYNNL